MKWPFAKPTPAPTDDRLFQRRNELRKAGVPKHRALILARVDMIREQQGQAPYNWPEMR